jgi:hypothetical protein
VLYSEAQKIGELIDILGRSKSFMVVGLCPGNDETEGDSYLYFCSEHSAEAGFIEYAALLHQERMEGMMRGGSNHSKDDQ